MNISKKQALVSGLGLSLGLLSCTASALPSKVSSAFLNSSSTLSLELIARYDAGELGIDAAVMEIISYNASNGHAYAVNGKTGMLAILSIQQLRTSSGAVAPIAAREFDVKSAVKSLDSSFNYKDMTSVAVSPDGQQLAIALQAQGHTEAGRVARFSCATDGSLSLLEVITVGVQPDMLCYADNNTILTANEGEPRQGYGAGVIDPKGSVSIINIASKSCTEAGFTAFDTASARAQLVSRGVILKKGALPSDDLEPEYITVAGTKAYIALQEANAIAVLNLSSKKIENIFSLGTTDHGKVALDLNAKDKKPVRRLHPGLYGVRMPDAITSYQTGGRTYLITANEGDGREWGKKKTVGYYENEVKIDLSDAESSPAGSIKPEQFGSTKLGKITLLDPSTVDGLDHSKDYLYGSRSFSIYEVSSSGLTPIFDSANQFEEVVAQTLGAYYQFSGDDLGLDDRSGKKGPEPECVTIGQIAGKPYAFIGLERTGGIMVYDISVPSRPQFVNYINTRDFNKIVTHQDKKGEDVAITGGDISPEGLAFVPAQGDKPAMLLVANEISGTVMAVKLSPTCARN